MHSIRCRSTRKALAGVLVALTLGTLAAGCARGPAPPETTTAEGLVVLLVADQFRDDYLDRFDPLLTGGLRRLLDQGVRFADTRHLHAITETAPGHATLATGSDPRHHGIVANYWYDAQEGSVVYSADAPEMDDSPGRLLVPTLGDWVKGARPDARVFSASTKDRAAIFLGGREADGAFWYDWDSGEMETSDYYFEGEPAWLRSFNDRRLLDRWWGSAWEAPAIPPETLAALGVVDADLGPLAWSWPHVFGGADPAIHEGFYRGLGASPVLDRHLVEFTWHLVETHDLGGGGRLDVLALSFSSLDYVGHRYGPDSLEVLDTILRLDEALGLLLERLDARLGLDRVFLALSSDHGVAPLPELRAPLGLPGRRIDPAVVLCVQRAEGALDERYGEDHWLAPGPRLDPATLERRGLPREALETTLAAALGRCPAVSRAWTRSELLPGPGDDPLQAAWARSFHPDRSPDFLLQFDPYFLESRSNAATHGSPWEYDTRVPFLLLAPGLAPGVHHEPAGTIDVAPTLAALAGVPYPATVDGTPRLER